MNAEQYTEAASKAVGYASSVEQDSLLEAATTWVKNHTTYLTKTAKLLTTFGTQGGRF
jgi:hypothetical protein